MGKADPFLVLTMKNGANNVSKLLPPICSLHLFKCTLLESQRSIRTDTHTASGKFGISFNEFTLFILKLSPYGMMEAKLIQPSYSINPVFLVRIRLFFIIYFRVKYRNGPCRI